MPSSDKRKNARNGMTLMEVVMATGLLTVILLPLFGLLSTVGYVYESTCLRRASASERQAVLRSLGKLMSQADALVEVQGKEMVLHLRSGVQATVEFHSGSIFWRVPGKTRALGTGLADVQFKQEHKGSLPNSGAVVAIRVATIESGDPQYSSTKVWIRPAM